MIIYDCFMDILVAGSSSSFVGHEKTVHEEKGLHLSRMNIPVAATVL